jgi:hypothetical protein
MNYNMKYIRLFEEFSNGELVTLNGEYGRIININGDLVEMLFFKPRRKETVNKEDIEYPIKCLANCDKKIIGQSDNRYVKCFYCGKEEKF